jgi:hypothetical protein
VLTNSLGVAIGTGFARHYFNEAGAIMARATSTGQFIASGVQGNQNAQFGNYISSLYDIEKTREMANRSATYESVAGGAAGLLGGTVSILGKLFEKNSILGKIGSFLSHGSKIATIASGAVGVAKGAELAAEKNQYTAESFALRGAIAKRQADASISEWQTPFSRWNLPTYNQEVASSQLTGGAPLKVSINKDFEKLYGSSSNYNAILNNVAPYLNKSPTSGDVNLNDVVQRFRKAGFAVDEFSKLTLQSSQYSALTGKNLDDFSKDLIKARTRFGEGFTSGTMQTALNLMSSGYSQAQAQSIAYQSQFNPNIANNIGRFSNIGVTDFYRNKALSDATGIDINQSLKTGQFVGSGKARKELQRELEQEQAGKSYGTLLTILNQGGGFSPASLRSLLQPRVAESDLLANTSAKLSPAQQAVQDIQNAIKAGFASVQNMTVNAQNVQVNSSNSGYIPDIFHPSLSSVIASRNAPKPMTPTNK